MAREVLQGAAFGGAIDNGRAEYGPGAVLQSEFLTYFINSLFFFICEESVTAAIIFSAIQQRYWPSNNDIGLGNRVDMQAASCNALRASFRGSAIAWGTHNVYNAAGL